jgi:hypothetical protein
MGRPFLYSLTYGEEGVVHAIESKSQSFSFISFFSLFPLSGPTLCVDAYLSTKDHSRCIIGFSTDISHEG